MQHKSSAAAASRAAAMLSLVPGGAGLADTGTHRAVRALFDSLPLGAALFERDGRQRHANDALRALLQQEPEARRLVSGIGELGRLLASRAAAPIAEGDAEVRGGECVTRELAIDGRIYRLLGGHVGRGASAPLLVVLVERLAQPALGGEELRARFRLTPRELDVCEQLALGRSNAEIALRLGISLHTTRRHAEHVLMKLGVHRRAEVGARLRGAGEG